MSSPISNKKQELLNNLDKDDIVSVFSFPKFRLEENTLIYLADNTEKGKHNFVGFRQSEFSGRFIFTISNKENQKQGFNVIKLRH